MNETTCKTEIILDMRDDLFCTDGTSDSHLTAHGEAGIVSQPHYYRLSSASDESPIKVLSIR